MSPESWQGLESSTGKGLARLLHFQLPRCTTIRHGNQKLSNQSLQTRSRPVYSATLGVIIFHFHFITYSLGCGASSDSSDILA